MGEDTPFISISHTQAAEFNKNLLGELAYLPLIGDLTVHARRGIR